MKPTPALASQSVTRDANPRETGWHEVTTCESGQAQEATPKPEPPPLPRRHRLSDRWLPLWWFGGALALVVGLRLAGQWQIPLPKCWLRTFTGIPCPSCGCTRSLLAWSDFDLGRALGFNPLFFLCCVTGIVWFALWLARQFFARPWLDQVRGRIAGWPVGQIFLTLVALNWLYLCLKLPK